MRNYTRNIKFILIGLIAMSISSCNELLDDEITDFGQGPNLVGFDDTSLTLNVEATGENINSGIPVNIIGPSVPSLSEDIQVTVNIEPTSTAVEGVHYSLDSNTFTLSPDGISDLYTGMLPITIITEGIAPPLDEAPILDINITQISSGSTVINDKTSSTSVSISYACPFDINNYTGTYLATTDEFGIYISTPQPFEVIAGPDVNQITLVNVAAHPEMYDVVINIDPETGDLTVPYQVALNYNNLGGTQYGELSWEGSGISGASPGYCIGELEITAGYTVDAGSFGEFTTVFTKQ